MENKYNYKLEEHLNNICQSNDEYKNLCSSWELSKKTYKQILRNVSANYPHYSLHDDSHSESIITNIEMLLGRERIEKLSPTDTWLILNCAYLHDFGMALLYSRIKEEWKSDKFQEFLKESEESFDVNLREACRYINNFNIDEVENTWPLEVRKYSTEIISSYFRGKHSLLSKDYINEVNEWKLDLTQNGLIHKRLINIMAEISFIHTQDFEEVLKLDYISNGYNSDYIHPRFIAELIRLGDVLDLDNGRFNEYTEKVTGHMPDTSKIHKEKHQSVTHVLITPESIEVRYDCSDIDIYREARRWTEYIESEIKNVTMSWSDIIPPEIGWYPPKFNKKELLLEGKLDEHNLSNLKFEISQEKAFHIIEGSNIYSDKLTFIREFIQNALDASKIQLYRDLKDGIYDEWIDKDALKSGINNLTPFDIDYRLYNNYKIEIELEAHGKNKVKVIIRDKGTGISIEDLKDICNVGNSYNFRRKYKNETKEMPLWLRPTGGFGIGIQSAFLVTDSIEAYTKSDSSGSLKINFASSKHNRYIDVKKEDKRIKRGTEFHISFEEKDRYLDEEELENSEYDRFSDKNALISSIKYYIQKNIEKTIFPITVDGVENFSIVKDIHRKFSENIKDNFKDEGNYRYGIMDDLSQMYLWDKESSTLINFRSGMYEIIDDNSMKHVSFKGCHLSSDDWRVDSYDRVDIYGLDTRKCLLIDRTGLTKDGVINVNKIVKDAHDFSLSKIKEKLDNSDNNIIENSTFNIEQFMLKYCLKNNFNDDDMMKYKELMDYLVLVFKYEKNKYEPEGVPLSDIIESYPNLNYVYTYGDLEYADGNEHRTMVLETLNENINSIGKYEYIVNDYLITNILNRLKKDKIEYVGCHYYEHRYEYNDVFICNSRNSIDSYQEIVRKPYIDMNIKTRNKLIEMLLVSEDIARCNIPVIKGYEELAIGGDVKGNLQSKAHIISPITYFDYSNMRNFMDIEGFIEMIECKSEYKNLVEYVCNNTIYDGNITEKIVSDKYKELIREYYKLSR